MAALIVVGLLATPLGNPLGLGPQSTVLNLKQSGLQSYYPGHGTNVQASNHSAKFAGDAASGNASYTVFEDSAFLHIGVKAPTNGSWAGYYQVTPSTYASLVHAVLSAPPTNLTGYFTNGIYVQASNQVLNYVTCVSVTNTTGTYWMVMHAHKSGNSASDFTTYDNLWHDTSKHQQLVRDCELVTNGQNALYVYLDHVLVYHSTSLNLGMQQPFNFFVGVESQYAHQLTYGLNRDFYVTNGGMVNVTGLSSKAYIAEIVDVRGNPLASGFVSSGTATINMGAFPYPVTGYVKVFDKFPTTNDSSGQLASTLSPTPIFGGDVFVLGSNPSTTSQLTIDAQDTSGNQLNGYYTVLMKEGVQTAADWIPTSFTLQSGQTYTILVSDYGHYVFDHWSDGSVSRIRTMSIAGPVSVAAIFRDKYGPSPIGHSLISVNAVDSSGKAIPGFYTILWQHGFMVAQAYSPASFLVDNNNAYQVTMSSYGGHVFAGWQGGSNDPYHAVTTGAGTITNVVAVYK
jgi:hypothetical protein